MKSPSFWPDFAVFRGFNKKIGYPKEEVPMDGYVRTRPTLILPALRFAGRLAFSAGIILGLLLGMIALAGIALAAI